MPRLLNTSPSAIKKLIRKAELLGLSPQTHLVGHEVGEIRRKWHVPAAFSLEFISYYIGQSLDCISPLLSLSISNHLFTVAHFQQIATIE